MSFQEFDAEWSAKHDVRRARPGGVRDTFYAAGYLEAEGRYRAALQKLCEDAADIEREWEDGSITSDGMAFYLNNLIRDANEGRVALAVEKMVPGTRSEP